MYKPEKVILYVKPVCGWCRQAEHWLKSQSIEFETVDVMEDPAAFEHMEKISGQTLAPVIEVDGQVLADFGARELVVFWEGLGKDALPRLLSQRISGRDCLNGFAYSYPPPARTLPHAI